MKVVLFGASGMVGQGVLRECVLDPEVESVLSIGRTPIDDAAPKVRQIAHADFLDFSAIQDQLTGLDVCLWCLGISSAGMNEADYTRVTHDYTLAAAKALLAASPGITFLFVSGGGTDSTEKGRSMWARVKGKTENALLAMPFEASYMFRPAMIQPRHGIRSKTPLYRAFYAVMGPTYPLWKAIVPRYVTTTENVGRAMLRVAKNGAAKRVLENHDIEALVRNPG